MKTKNSITDEEKLAIKLFGEQLVERIKKLTKINGDKNMGDFILNSAFEFLDELELNFDLYLKKQDSKLRTAAMEKMLNKTDKILKICGYKNIKDFMHDASGKFLDRIDRWFNPSLEQPRKLSKVFHFDSQIRDIADDDKKNDALKKFQATIQKEFASYLQNIAW